MNWQSRVYGLVRGLVILTMLLGLLLLPSPTPSAALAPASPAAVPCGPHVYFDIYHDSGDTQGHYQDLTSLVVSGLGGSFEEKDQPIDTAALAGYNVLALADPEVALAPAEIAAISNFVIGGGRLVVVGEWGGAMKVDTVNDLLAGVGVYISFNADMVHDPTDNEGLTTHWPRIHQFANHPLTDGVGWAALYAAASLNVAPPAVALASGDDDAYTAVSATTGLQDDDGLGAEDLAPQAIYPGAPIVMAYSWAGAGSVFVVTDSGLWADGDVDGDGVANLDEFDHRQLAHNVFDHPWCRPAGCHRILFDETHGWSQYTIEDRYAELAAFLRGQGHLVQSLQDPAPLDRATLLRYDVLVLTLPKDYYTPTEKAAISWFVAGGGRLVTIGEWGAFAGISHDILNDVHAHLGDGLLHNDDTVHDPTDNLGGLTQWPIIHTFAPNPVNDGVGHIVEPAGSSLQVSGPAFATAFGDEDTYVVTSALAGGGGSDGPLAADGVPEGGASGPEVLPAQSVVVQAMAHVGTGDVFAVGDTGLWSQHDSLGDGRMNLYRYDNAQLALNVFARGEWCRHCPVALFKDQNPWGPALTRVADSTTSVPPVPAADEALLDVEGNLPPGSGFAPAAPLALGDVVNEFPGPTSGSLTLEWIDGFLWVASFNQDYLYRLAPSDGTVLETVSLPASLTSCGLAWDGSSFWIADCSADEIVQVSSSGMVIGSFPSPGPGPVGLAWDGAYLWDVDFEADQIHRIDPATGIVVHTIPAPDTRAAGLAWDGQYLWTNGRDSAITYKLDPWVGSVHASFGTPPGSGMNNGRGAAFDGQYLWVSNSDVGIIYQIDVEHVPSAYADPNEEILHAWGTPYDVWGTADIGTVDLAPYCRVIVESAQPYALYEAVSIQRAWFEPWVAAGGILEFHGATTSSQDWSGLTMPGGFSMAWDPQNDVTAIDYGHPILSWPNVITGAELDGWNTSAHGYLVDLPWLGRVIIVHEPSGEPATAELTLGRGCVLATAQTLEWAWMHGDSAILENVILSGCTGSRVYLPLVTRNYP